MNINVVFCFDENLQFQIQPAIASLLDSNKDSDVHYMIYCVCTKEMKQLQDKLQKIIQSRDSSSALVWMTVDNPYKDSYQVRGISTGTYLRLMLPEFLVGLDRVIYTDVDVLFRGNLALIWDINMQGKLIAGVKGAVNLHNKWEWNSSRPYWKELAEEKGKYINAGITVLNLKEMRTQKIMEKWKTMADYQFYYQDQDILNITCKGKIAFLPPKYNCMAYMNQTDYDAFVTERIYTREEASAAYDEPVILHYAGDKPWKRYDTNRGNLWWEYVNSQEDLQGLFDENMAKLYHGPGIMERGIRKIKKIFGSKCV